MCLRECVCHTDLGCTITHGTTLNTKAESFCEMTSAPKGGKIKCIMHYWSKGVNETVASTDGLGVLTLTLWLH